MKHDLHPLFVGIAIALIISAIILPIAISEMKKPQSVDTDVTKSSLYDCKKAGGVGIITSSAGTTDCKMSLGKEL